MDRLTMGTGDSHGSPDAGGDNMGAPIFGITVHYMVHPLAP